MLIEKAAAVPLMFIARSVQGGIYMPVLSDTSGQVFAGCGKACEDPGVKDS